MAVLDTLREPLEEGAVTISLSSAPWVSRVTILRSRGVSSVDSTALKCIRRGYRAMRV